MWNYLERLFGKSSRYYESLMRSRDAGAAITANQLMTATSLLQPLLLPAYEFEMGKASNLELPPPKNSKNQAVPYYGTITHPTYELHLFLNKDKMFQDPSNVQLILTEKLDAASELVKIKSLPIWEEVIHHDATIHHQIVDTSPKNPWSLYRAAKEELIGSTKKNQVAGYPQWLVNDIDFRKIASQEFLFQMELTDSEQVIYLFTNSTRAATDFYVQKL
ncbi:hypothetical protein [Nonlabens marinus]|uniref:Uncharacterized protein n=1 Tax=Nonlabens marinus S1-08 TaxID=1454201 RepID=W8VWD1_9FLAO|nr:hypothetical protein [Nonlabens marinus]BAO56203.1 hypothetical protein NMS_2194 [Nonlabens marinus S1-08]